MKDLCQFFTPLWVAEAIVDRHFSRLDASDVMLDPSCGPGAFLRAMPSHVQAVGVELDPLVASEARAFTGRTVIDGDFMTAHLVVQPTVIIGNPPFRGVLIDSFLQRCHSLLPDGGRAGFILPAYAFRTASRVVGMLDFWSVSQELLPRSAFCSRMREPLVFALFAKDKRRMMIGFALFEEEADRQQMQQAYRRLLAQQTGSAWRAVCSLALSRLGGEATLAQLYSELEGNRPTRTQWWREKIRQTLRAYGDFVAVDTGKYRLVS